MRVWNSLYKVRHTVNSPEELSMSTFNSRIRAFITTFKYSLHIFLWSVSMDYFLAMLMRHELRKTANIKEIRIKGEEEKWIHVWLFVNTITSTLTWAMNFSQTYWKGHWIFHSFHIRKKNKAPTEHTHTYSFTISCACTCSCTYTCMS